MPIRDKAELQSFKKLKTFQTVSSYPTSYLFLNLPIVCLQLLHKVKVLGFLIHTE